MKGCIVDATYEVEESATKVMFFGRLENGQSFITSNTLKPYFFIQKKDRKKAAKFLTKFTVEETKEKTFSKGAVIKISHPLTTELNKLAQVLHRANIETFEADVKPIVRFKIDHDIFTTISIEGEHTSTDKIDRLYAEPKITPTMYQPALKIVSLDTESNKHTGALYCIGLYTENYQKNFMVTSQKLKNTVACATEAECLQKFKAELLKLDPDIIIGWSVIDFDLTYLKDKFKQHHVDFDLGRTLDPVRIRIESNFFRSSSVDMPGRQVLDALALIRDPFIQEAPSIRNAEFESYTLEDVSQVILKTGKLLKGKGRHEELEKLYVSDQQKVVDYNLLDCKLVYDIALQTKIIDLALERSQLTALPLDKLGSSIAAFDSLYIRAARKVSLVSPTTRFSEKEERIKGGYVKSLQPGIYHNVLVLDFKSLYPSIITTFNIDPASHLTKKEKGAIQAPNNALFRNTHGILPQIIQRLHAAREKAKAEKRELASYAIKIIMNSFFGILANPNSRYFSLEVANAITHFGQMIIKLTGEKIEEQGYKVIYSDTDSIFIESDLPKEKANAVGKKIALDINEFYKKYVQENYGRESFLELQFDKQYLSLMIPKVRNATNETAAKKRYAGLVEKEGKEILEIVGLEAIRGDWTDAAGQFQRTLLLRVFHKEPVENFIREYLKDIRAGKMDAALVYKKSIRKELDEYTKTTPPHVKAARQLDHLDSNVIQYYMTLQGPEPIQKLRHKIDYEHYITKQIAPIAQQVLSLLGKNFDELVQSVKQKKLF